MQPGAEDPADRFSELGHQGLFAFFNDDQGGLHKARDQQHKYQQQQGLFHG